jgi:hypothetical protein
MSSNDSENEKGSVYDSADDEEIFGSAPTKQGSDSEGKFNL